MLNWIRMREDLHEDPAVLAMADALQVRPECVVGYCHKFWCWVSRNTRDGCINNVRIASVESVLNIPTFCTLMQQVGWLEVTTNDSGVSCIRVPNFERYLSEGSKQRALATRRQQSRRCHKNVTKVSRSQSDKSVTREEKRREDINTPCKSLFCAPTVDDVATYCTERDNSVDPVAFMAHYEANGWVQGRGKPIKDWKAAVRVWERNSFGAITPAGKPKTTARCLTDEEMAEYCENPTDPKWKL